MTPNPPHTVALRTNGTSDLRTGTGLQARALMTGVATAALAVAALSVWVLVGLDGWDYYTTPIRIRGYHTAHPVLRPSGAAGLTFGMTGAALMLAPFAYMLLKRIPRLRAGASMRSWLEFHIFCGITGPVLVTYHTSFKFNGLVSVAYWSMVLVALSGFVGRYLYVRIPRTIRGAELTEGELAERAADLKEELLDGAAATSLERLEAFESEAASPEAWAGVVGFLFGGILLARRLRALERDLVQGGASDEQVRAAVQIMAERGQIARRLRHLRTTKKLFDLWHVFHLPLVYVMFAIVSMHVALALYLGYGPYLWRAVE